LYGKIKSQEAKLGRSYRKISLKMSNRFAALKNSDDSKDKNMAWENITNDIKFG
jgi:hypothetical protein